MSTNSKEIVFPNLVESCRSLSNGNVIKLTPGPNIRVFSASNARCEAAVRTRFQVREHAKKVAKLMCNI